MHDSIQETIIHRFPPLKFQCHLPAQSVVALLDKIHSIFSLDLTKDNAHWLTTRGAGQVVISWYRAPGVPRHRHFGRRLALKADSLTRSLPDTRGTSSGIQRLESRSVRTSVPRSLIYAHFVTVTVTVTMTANITVAYVCVATK